MTKFYDGLLNYTANLGTQRDKASASVYADRFLTDDQMLAAYRGSWLSRKIVDIPADDACRKWRSWMADADQIEQLEAEEKRLRLCETVKKCLTVARLFGGAAIFIGTGERDTQNELRPESIGLGGIKYLTILNRRQITPTELETDPQKPNFMRPKAYRMQDSGVEIHPSRLIVFIGAEHPDPELASGAEYGWGDSVLMSAFDAVRNSDSTDANVASLIFEAKVDVFKIPGFMSNLENQRGTDYESLLLKRFTLAATAKGINGALLLDKEEEYESKSAAFAGLTDIMSAFIQRASGAADIPVTRLLGQSPAGLNSTGESDLRNYYDGIQAMQELEISPAMHLFDECLIRSALGSRPPEVHYRWRDLWQMRETERSTMGKTIADTIATMQSTMLFPDEALSKAAMNALTENGILPGLEAAINEFASTVEENYQ